MADLIDKEKIVCLLLGSNIEPSSNMKKALELLRRDMNLLQVSSVWKTKAIGSPGPDFLNTAVLAKTKLNADTLKNKVLRPLENTLGRVREKDKNAPRTIDIDIILYDGLVLDQGLFSQAHIAVPMAEIAPFTLSPEGVLLRDIAKNLTKETSLTLMPGVL